MAKLNTKRLHLITAVVQAKYGNHVLDAALKAGATGATYFFAQGTGIRQTMGDAGAGIEIGKRVLFIITDADKTDAVMKVVAREGKLDTPGAGIAFVQDVLRVAGAVPPGVTL